MWNRYRDVNPIRGGGFADVYSAIDIRSGITVAIKFLRDCSPENLRRFKRERDMVIFHEANPHVVNLLDSDLNAQPPYLVLEFANAGSLQYYVNNRRDWKRIAGWLCQIARGLEIIHARGEWHRDIKPSNILLFKYTQGEVVKLTDFGLAQKPSNNSSSMTCSPYGTQGYIDPAAISSGRYTWESDIYSLGVTMRELLTGSKIKPIFQIFQDLPGPFEFQQLIEWMCDPDPNNRPDAAYIYQTVERLLHPLAIAPVQRVSGWDIALGVLKGLQVATNILNTANKWDNNAQRFRNSKGQFQSGWLNPEKVNQILSHSLPT